MQFLIFVKHASNFYKFRLPVKNLAGDDKWNLASEANSGSLTV